MKSKITALFLIFITTMGFAQEHNDSTYFYDGLSLTWKLDSREYVLERNNQGMVLSAVHHSYDDDTGTWSDKYQITYTYQSDDVTVDTYLKEVWNPVQSEWVEIEYREYNSNSDLIQSFNKNWDFETNQLIDGNKTTYNRSGDKIISTYKFSLNTAQNTWEYNFYEEYTYDTDELLTEKIKYEFNGSWNYYEKANYFYNSNDLVNQIFTYTFLNATGDWIENQYYSYVYNSNDLVTETIVQTKQGSIWWKTIKEEREYNTNNTLNNHTVYLGDDVSNLWEEYEREFYYYNTNGTNNYSIKERYNSDWEYYLRTGYEYDYNDNLTAKRIKSWYNNTWNDNIEYIYEYNANNKTLEYKRHKATSGFWICDYKNEYYWFDEPTVNAGNNDEVECMLEYVLNANEPEAGQTGTWSLNNGTGSFSDVHAYNATFTASEPGAYNLTWTVFNGINDFSDYVTITFLEDTEPPIITCVGDQEVQADQTNTYTVQGTEFDLVDMNDNCGIAIVENDYNNTSTLAGEEIPAGTYNISWLVEDNSNNPNICNFILTVNEFVGIADLSENEFSIYPNPTNGVIIIASEAKQSIKNIEITNLTGKTIQQFNNLTIQQFNNLTINLTTQPSGIYFLKITTNKRVFTEKIIKK